MATHFSFLISDDAYTAGRINDDSEKSGNSSYSVRFAVKDELTLVEIGLNCGV